MRIWLKSSKPHFKPLSDHKKRKEKNKKQQTNFLPKKKTKPICLME